MIALLPTFVVPAVVDQGWSEPSYWTGHIVTLAYIVAAILFILSLRGLSSHETSRQGNNLGITGMTIALAATILAALTGEPGRGVLVTALLIGVAMLIGATIGLWRAAKVEMTGMPELIALLHSFVGLAAVLVGFNSFLAPDPEAILLGGFHMGEVFLGVFIGAVTFTGSIVAYLKLSGKISGAPLMLPARNMLNLGAIVISLLLMVWFIAAGHSNWAWFPFIAMTVIALALGVHLVAAIGGGDMPVVVSMLNSYSGWAAAAAGFMLNNDLLIITGALVGASGAFLSFIMCRAMNRSFISVILGGFGGESAGPAAKGEAKPVKQGSAEDAAFVMKNAGSVIIVPGYGMAVAQAQHALREMADHLKKEGVSVNYAIHPVAGRMPGHMNVLLAEANVPYDEVFELEDINSDFGQADVAFVIGANDVTNPSAKDDPTSPIYGMPVLDVEKAGTVLFIKRSMGSGYAGVESELFFRDNTMMLFADAKKMVEGIVKAL